MFGTQTLTQEQWEALHAPFPPEALSNDSSRGFDLTSIRAAYVIERLNEVFGPCGIGWRYAHSPFEAFDLKNGSPEIVTEVAFQYRLNGESGCPPAEWCALTHGWSWRDSAPATWSEPIFACGGKAVTKGGAPHTDARKSAVTDGITKAASLLGVGHLVFKGLIRVSADRQPERKPHGQPPVPRLKSDDRKPTLPDNGKHPTVAPQATSPTPGTTTPKNGGQPTAPIKEDADATTFWALYHREAKPVGISQQDAQALVHNDNWAMACANLRVLISKAPQPVRAN